MQPTTTVGCIACGDETAVTKRSKAIHEGRSRGFLCENCFGIYHLPDDTPECDVHDCEDLAPFAIRTQHGDRQRCRYHLRTNLETGMWLTREPVEGDYETPEWLREYIRGEEGGA